MQTLKAYLRSGKTGPGVFVSIPMPPEGKPIPQVVRFAGMLYDFEQVLNDCGLLYLRRRGITQAEALAEPNAFQIDHAKTAVRPLPGHVRYGQ